MVPKEETMVSTDRFHSLANLLMGLLCQTQVVCFPECARLRRQSDRQQRFRRSHHSHGRLPFWGQVAASKGVYSTACGGVIAAMESDRLALCVQSSEASCACALVIAACVVRIRCCIQWFCSIEHRAQCHTAVPRVMLRLSNVMNMSYPTL
jgi:hypothetical protein